MTNIYGGIKTAKHVRIAVTETIKTWFPEYIAEIGERDGRERTSLPVFRSFVPMLNVNKFVEDQVPSCIIVCPGTLSTRRRHGQQDATFAVGIGAVVSGQDQENTFELCELYQAAMISCLLQHPSLGGFAEGISLVSTRNDELDVEDSRTLGAATIQLAVDVNGIVDLHAGPTTPAVDATVEPGELGQAQTVGTTFTGTGS